MYHTKKIFHLSLLFFLFVFTSASAWAVDKFSRVSPSGHTLYYAFVKNNGVVIGVSVNPPSSHGANNAWNGYTKPVGNLIIPSNVTYGGQTYDVLWIQTWAFFGCTGLTSVTIPPTVTDIQPYAFQQCTGLTTVNIESNSNLKTIGHRAFYDCTSLVQSLTLPEGFEYTGSEVFGNTIVYELNMPTTWGRAYQQSNAFVDSYIETINVAPGNPYYQSYDGVVFSRGGDTLLFWPPGKDIVQGDDNFISTLSMLSGFTIKAIGPDAFHGMRCVYAHNAIIPKNVVSVGKSAFRSCENLTSVVIGNDVRRVGVYAFADCEELRSVTIGSHMDTLSQYSFYGSRNIEDVTCKNAIPPIVIGISSSSTGDPFASSPNALLKIPCNQMQVYRQADGWGNHTHYQEDFVYTAKINTLVLSLGEGTASIIQEPSCSNNQTMRIIATPNQGYEFTGWAVYGDYSSGHSVSFYNDNPQELHVDNDFDIWPIFQTIGRGNNAITTVEKLQFDINVDANGLIVHNTNGYILNIYDIMGRSVYHGINVGQRIPLPHRGVFIVHADGYLPHKIVY